MRKYTPKDNVQGKSYYTDRYWVAPRVPRSEVEAGSHFADVVSILGKLSKEAYVEIGQLVVHIDATQNLEVLSALKNKCGYTQCSEQSAVDYLHRMGNLNFATSF